MENGEAVVVAWSGASMPLEVIDCCGSKEQPVCKVEGIAHSASKAPFPTEGTLCFYYTKEEEPPSECELVSLMPAADRLKNLVRFVEARRHDRKRIVAKLRGGSKLYLYQMNEEKDALICKWAAPSTQPLSAMQDVPPALPVPAPPALPAPPAPPARAEAGPPQQPNLQVPPPAAPPALQTSSAPHPGMGGGMGGGRMGSGLGGTGGYGGGSGGGGGKGSGGTGGGYSGGGYGGMHGSSMGGRYMSDGMGGMGGGGMGGGRMGGGMSGGGMSGGGMRSSGSYGGHGGGDGGRSGYGGYGGDLARSMPQEPRPPSYEAGGGPPQRGAGVGSSSSIQPYRPEHLPPQPHGEPPSKRPRAATTITRATKPLRDAVVNLTPLELPAATERTGVAHLYDVKFSSPDRSVVLSRAKQQGIFGRCVQPAVERYMLPGGGRVMHYDGMALLVTIGEIDLKRAVSMRTGATRTRGGGHATHRATPHPTAPPIAPPIAPPLTPPRHPSRHPSRHHSPHRATHRATHRHPIAPPIVRPVARQLTSHA